MNCSIGARISTVLCLVLNVAAWSGGFSTTASAVEQKFDSIQVGTHTYTNVTVTTKARSYVFILHSEGMTNLKISELPGDVLEKLGYENPNVPKVQTNGPAVWAKQTMAKLDSPEVKEIQQDLKTKWNSSPAGARIPLPDISRTLVIQVAVGLFALYLFYCFCCMQICAKAGSKPGLLIWIPLLQLFPLLKAARMSGWWFLAFFVPLLNLVAQILWCFKIADARGKTAFVGFLLFFPITSIFAFLYLAFSNGAPPPKPSTRQRPVELMTLEAA